VLRERPDLAITDLVMLERLEQDNGQPCTVLLLGRDFVPWNALECAQIGHNSGHKLDSAEFR
jgi:hypothetical protein